MKIKKIGWSLYLMALLLISMAAALYLGWRESVLPVDKNSMTYYNGSLYGIENTAQYAYTLYKADMTGKIDDWIEWTIDCQPNGILEVSYVPGYEDKDLYAVRELDAKADVSSYQLYCWDHENKSLVPFLDVMAFISEDMIPNGFSGSGTVIAYKTRRLLDTNTSEFSYYHIGKDGQPVFDGSINGGTYSIQNTAFFQDYGWIIVDGYGNCLQLQEGKTRTIFENDGLRFTTHNVMISLGDGYIVMRNLDEAKDLCIFYDDPDVIHSYPYSETIEFAGKLYEDETFVGTHRAADGSILYGFIETDDGKTLFCQAEQGEVLLQQVSYPYSYVLRKSLPCFFLFAAAGLLAGAVIWVWRYVYHGRLSLYVKILTIMLASIAVITNIVYKQNYNRVSEEITESEIQNLYRDAKYQMNLLDLDILSQIADTYQVLPEDIRARLFQESNFKGTKTLYDMNSHAEEAFTLHRSFYPQYFLCRGNDIYYLTYDGVANAQYQYAKSKLVVDAVRKAITEETIVSMVYQNNAQKVRGLFVPIRKSDRTVIGAIEVMEPEDDMLQEIQSATADLRRYQSLWYGVLLLILMLSIYLFLRPLKILRRMADRLGKGDLSVRMKVRGNDEISEISAVFNQMAEGVGKHLTELQRYTDAYAKFLPNETFRAMGKENITQMTLMSEANMPAVILVTATNLYEEMLPFLATKNIYVFDFINDALRVQIPAIARHGGNAGSFEDAGSVAYFTENPEAALQAAIDAVDALNKNELYLEKKKASFQAAIGFGMLHMGVVGIAKRMMVQNISEEENLVKFLRGIAEEYGAEILVLEEAAKQIPAFSENYRVRALGYVRLSADQSLRLVYEVFDTNDAKMRLGKEQTKEIYEKGIRLFWEGKAAEARNCFVQLLRVNKFDKAAQKYFYLCDQYMNEQRTDYDCWIEEY